MAKKFTSKKVFLWHNRNSNHNVCFFAFQKVAKICGSILVTLIYQVSLQQLSFLKQANKQTKKQMVGLLLYLFFKVKLPYKRLSRKCFLVSKSIQGWNNFYEAIRPSLVI